MVQGTGDWASRSGFWTEYECRAKSAGYSFQGLGFAVRNSESISRFVVSNSGGLGFWVSVPYSDLVSDFGFRFWKVPYSDPCRISGVGFRVSGFGFRVPGFRFRVSGTV